MSAIPRTKLTPEEYLAIERKSEERHEFYNGEMFAMSGASANHNQIAGNIFASLHGQLSGKPCTAFILDLRVKVDRSGLYTYPDIAVVCDEPRFEDGHVDTLLNPRVLVEVLSDSTESYDRGKKFELYRQIDSLKEYLLVSQNAPHIDHFKKNEAGQWVLEDASGLEASIELPTIECRLTLADVYTDVEFTDA